MPVFSFRLNGAPVRVDVDADTPLLWALRDGLGRTGTKFGCGVGACGACTVHIGGVAMRSCLMPVAGVVGQDVTTIEGIDHAVQRAWLEHQVPQCGYCQSGQIMAAVALLARDPDPDDAAVEAAMTNLCRCATYDRIRDGLHAAARALRDAQPAPVEPAPSDASPAPSDASPAPEFER